jgi:hypothetical protein
VAIELCSSAQGSNSAIQQCLLDVRFASEGGRRLLRCGISIRLMTAQDHKQTFGDVLP